MKTVGEYQNNINKLPRLDLERYERIFKLFEIENKDKSFYFYNISKKIQFPDVVDDQYTSLFTVKTPLPLATISYQIYQDIRLWWLIYLLNSKIIGSNIFIVPTATQLKYIKREFLDVVFSEITNITIFNGRHY